MSSLSLALFHPHEITPSLLFSRSVWARGTQGMVHQGHRVARQSCGSLVSVPGRTDVNTSACKELRVESSLPSLPLEGNEPDWGVRKPLRWVHVSGAGIPFPDPPQPHLIPKQELGGSRSTGPKRT